MRRILLIANYKGSIGGISSQVEMLYKHLQADNIPVRIFSTYGNIFKRLVLLVQLIVVTKQYNVLHIHGCSKRGFLPIVYGTIAGKIMHKRIIITYHGGDADNYFQHHTHWVKFWFKNADTIIVLNSYLENVFKKHNIPCTIIPNIIDFYPVHKTQSNTIRFISVRHLRDLYNIPCILKAYKIVKAKEPNISLTILGDGPIRQKLEDWVINNHVCDIKFIGQIPNSKIQEYWNNSDIMLSAPHIDNMPVSVLEAMHSEVLVISSRVGGVPYLIDENRTGILFNDDNYLELADKMLWAIQHPAEMQIIIANAKNEVQKYQWESIKRQILYFYE